jgi:gliding motility-associated-like protein
MKNYLLTLLLTPLFNVMNSQVLDMWTLPSSASNSSSLNWTIGEVTIFTGESIENYLTQGFQQPNTPGIDIIHVSDTALCEGTSLTIEFSALGYFESNNVFTVILSDLNGSFNNPLPIGEGVSSPIVCSLPLDILPSSNYAIQVKSNSPILYSNIIGTIDIFPQPDVSITTSSIIYCQNSVAELTAEGAESYEWSNNETSNPINVIVSSDTTISTIGTDANGCTSISSIELSIGSVGIETCNGIDDDCDEEIDEGFDLDFDGFTICNGDCDDSNNSIFPGAIDIDDDIDNDCDEVIDENADTDGDGYSPDDGDCNDADPNIHPNAIETCNEIDDDCDSLIDEELNCNNAIFIPNGISPNGDGMNDVWLIQGLESYPYCEISVVNRWNQLVFKSTGYNEYWNGTYNGHSLPIGDYFYRIKITEDLIFTGFVSIKN